MQQVTQNTSLPGLSFIAACSPHSSVNITKGSYRVQHEPPRLGGLHPPTQSRYVVTNHATHTSTEPQLKSQLNSFHLSMKQHQPIALTTNTLSRTHHPATMTESPTRLSRNEHAHRCTVSNSNTCSSTPYCSAVTTPPTQLHRACTHPPPAHPVSRQHTCHWHKHCTHTGAFHALLKLAEPPFAVPLAQNDHGTFTRPPPTQCTWHAPFHTATRPPSLVTNSLSRRHAIFHSKNEPPTHRHTICHSAPPFTLHQTYATLVGIEHQAKPVLRPSLHYGYLFKFVIFSVLGFVLVHNFQFVNYCPARGKPTYSVAEPPTLGTNSSHTGFAHIFLNTCMAVTRDTLAANANGRFLFSSPSFPATAPAVFFFFLSRAAIMSPNAVGRPQLQEAVTASHISRQGSPRARASIRFGIVLSMSSTGLSLPVMTSFRPGW